MMDYFPAADAPERRAPLWARMMGKHHYNDSYRFSWGEISTRGWPFALRLGCYGRPHLNIGIGFMQVFINLPLFLKPLFEQNDEGDRKQFGFSTTDGDLHLAWGHHYKIIWSLNGSRHEKTECLQADGSWYLQPARYCPDEVVPPLWSADYPFHYMTPEGQAQHVVATVTRERSTWRKRFFGIRLRRRVSHTIQIHFSEEVGNQRGSWKGGVVGCSYEMKPGESPRRALSRMQRERNFDR